MRKRRLEIGKLVRGTKLRVLERLESDAHGNQRVLVRCEWTVNGECCGVIKPMRVTDMTRRPFVDKDGKARLPHRSCGCQARRARREYLERGANGLPAGVRRGILLRVDSGHSIETVAHERHLPVSIVSTVYRLEVAALRPEVERWVEDNCPAGTKVGPFQRRQFLNEATGRLYDLISRENRRARRRARPTGWLAERIRQRIREAAEERKARNIATAAQSAAGEPQWTDGEDLPF